MTLPGFGTGRRQQGMQGGHAGEGWEAGCPGQGCFGHEGFCVGSWRPWGTFPMT